MLASCRLSGGCGCPETKASRSLVGLRPRSLHHGL